MKGKAKAKRGISHIKDARMIQNLKKNIKEKADSDPTQEVETCSNLQEGKK